jgi:thiol-disulfide isomerase/thioredoxin
MSRTLVITTVLLLFAGTSVFAFLNWNRTHSTRTETSKASLAKNDSDVSVTRSSDENGRDVLISAKQARSAPSLKDGTWINSDALTLEGLKGRVVVVDFWTYGCYNCRNTLPALKRWDSLYREQGLTIIGVHTPEFDSEKSIQSVREQVRELGIRYPVLTDNNNDTWHAYNVHAWPTVVILDKEGRIRWTHVGEGLYKEQEAVIKSLLAE